MTETSPSADTLITSVEEPSVSFTFHTTFLFAAESGIIVAVSFCGSVIFQPICGFHREPLRTCSTSKVSSVRSKTTPFVMARYSAEIVIFFSGMVKATSEPSIGISSCVPKSSETQNRESGTSS